MDYTRTANAPLVLSASTQSQVYGYFALAMALTVAGVWVGIMFAETLFSTGLMMILLLAELGLIFTSSLWVRVRPLNVILFALFPFLSGLTITPYLASIIVQYANGFSIILNATIATTLMTAAMAVFARTTSLNLSSMSRFVLVGLLGMIVLGLLQLFIPALRGTNIELLVSGLGIGLFSFIIAFDLQRIQSMGQLGAEPLLLALSLYLDVYNLFLYVLRFMVAISGRRR